MDKWTEQIDKQGWKHRVVPIGHLPDLKEAIESRYGNGLIDPMLYEEQLGFFSFDPPDGLPDACSILILAVPTPQMRIFFHWKGSRIPVIIPPTYVSYTPRTSQAQSLLGGWLQQEGYSLTDAKLPLKTLAVRSGLAEYGRNNITYVPGMGSFQQLVGAYTDLPCSEDPWREPKVLDRCERCTACIKKCPTGAISADRFLLHAELCLTYHNEAHADFPSWIYPEWHHCLIGCMQCQTCCPENKAFLNWFEDRAEFSEDESGMMIRSVPYEELPPGMKTKLRELEINEDYRFLCRNLSMILKR